MEWFFDGIGTELISLIIGLLVGGTAGSLATVKIFKRKNKDNSKVINKEISTQGGDYVGRDKNR